MRLSSCRGLKRTLLDRAYSLPSATCDRRRYRVPRARRGAPRSFETHEGTPLAAIGIAPAAGAPDGYRVAVRVFAGHDRHVSRLLAGLERHEAELDVATGVRYEPRLTLRAGGSIGHFRVTAGTLGAFVEDDERYYLLSNNHVFANSNCAFAGDAILQPGPIDIRGRHHVVGSLTRWPPLAKDRTDGIDAALATFSDEVEEFEPWEYRGIGTIGRAPVADRFSVTRVAKRGRTTRVTRGSVSAFELDGVAIDYGTPSEPAVVVFDDQVELVGDPPRRPFSAGGDSGALVIDRDTMQGFALLYGGGPDADGIDRSVAHFLPDVLGALGVRLVR